MSRVRDSHTGWPKRKAKQTQRRRTQVPKYSKPAARRTSRLLAAELIELMSTRTPEPPTEAQAQPIQKVGTP
jgi:hypothetical protein